MNLLSRYTRSVIALVFGVAFLYVAPRFATVAHDAPAGALNAFGRPGMSIVEFVNGCPAGVFSVVGTGLLVFAAIYAIYVTGNNRY